MKPLLIVLLTVASAGNCYGQLPAYQFGTPQAHKAESNHNRISPDEMAEIERLQAASRPKKFVAPKGKQLTTQQRAYNRWFDKTYYIGRNGHPMLRRPGVPLRPPKVDTEGRIELVEPKK